MPCATSEKQREAWTVDGQNERRRAPLGSQCLNALTLAAGAPPINRSIWDGTRRRLWLALSWRATQERIHNAGIGCGRSGVAEVESMTAIVEGVYKQGKIELLQAPPGWPDGR